MLANGGYLLPPVLVRKISTTQGEVLFEAPDCAPTKPNAPPASATPSSPAPCYRSHPQRHRRPRPGRPEAPGHGKTGTTNEVVDAWFCRLPADRAAVVWIGMTARVPWAVTIRRIAATASLDRLHGHGPQRRAGTRLTAPERATHRRHLALQLMGIGRRHRLLAWTGRSLARR